MEWDVKIPQAQAQNKWLHGIKETNKVQTERCYYHDDWQCSDISDISSVMHLNQHMGLWLISVLPLKMELLNVGLLWESLDLPQ